MNQKSQIFKKIAQLSEAEKEFAVVTVVSATEGTPRGTGTRMIVYPGGETEFTVGGGNLEEIAKKKALKALKEGEDTLINAELKLKGNAGMVCGGEAELYIEVFKSSSEVVIFGGGHIGLALAGFFDILGVKYRIFDNREDFCSKERFPNAAGVSSVEYGDKIITEGLNIGDKSYCVIVTHGHMGDKKVLKSLLKTKAPYIGMIGSGNKVKAVMDMLAAENVDIKSAQERIFTPIGLDIGGDTPEEIAISIIAEIFKIKNGGSGKSIKDKVE
ncbi:MAG: XdhC/CoxI family protein [Elusimicrobia bacterium]|nr:XdhC/CoxI family protein [Elusimicrobiota bacterium]